MIHPSLQLDDLVHQRVRLGLLAVLEEAERAEFTTLRDLLDLTDGNLNRHLAVLAEAGYVDINKEKEGRRLKTWVSSTPEGKAALKRNLAALDAIIQRLGARE